MGVVEICFARWICLPSSEWAAWWKGVGTVIAVVTALGVALYQQRAQSRDTAREAAEAMQRSARMAILYGVKLRDSLHALKAACEKHDDPEVSLQRRILRDMQRWPEEIDVSRLKTTGALGFLNLRSLCAEAVAMEERGNPLMIRAEEYGALTVHVDAHLKAIAATFPKAA
jgi:hypothetical protein